MQRIGDSTNTANAAGEYTEGNPAAGVAATLIKAAWLNAIQRELINVLDGAGIRLDPTDDRQLIKAITELLSKKLSLSGGQVSGQLAVNAGVRSKKGLPKNDAADLGYAFGVDGDSGFFATEGTLPQSASELVLMSDSIELARFSTTKTTIPNAVLPGATTDTPAAGTKNKSIASTEFVAIAVQAAINALINGAPGALDTLEELSRALGNDANFAASVNNALAARLALSGGLMTGALRAKTGASGANNPNNCGFVFDIDTGLFSPSDGEIELVSNGDVLLRRHSAGAVQLLRQLRVPKGPPDLNNSSSLSGYSFGDDGDTGIFAEGGVPASSSDIVFRIDGAEAGRIKPLMKSSAKNGWGRLLNGQIIQCCEFSVQHVAGAAVQWTITYPTSFLVRAMQPMVCLGSGLGASSISYSVEGFGISSASGYVYSSDATSRIYRLWIIGE